MTESGGSCPSVPTLRNGIFILYGEPAGARLRSRGQTLGQTANSRQKAPEIHVSPGFAAHRIQSGVPAMQTILVIDDDESLRDTIGVMLERDGFRAAQASDRSEER